MSRLKYPSNYFVRCSLHYTEHFLDNSISESEFYGAISSISLDQESIRGELFGPLVTLSILQLHG